MVIRGQSRGNLGVNLRGIMDLMDIIIAVMSDPAVGWPDQPDVLEVVLGIDNVVFIAIMAARVDPEQSGAHAPSASASPWASGWCCR